MQTYPTGYAESHRMVEQIFREILPRRGMAVREEQIALCHEVLDTLYNKEISLCEAGVGIGKTLAYLVACILWQMHRPNQLKMPVVISTSSVALQDAILNEYLPDLSAVLLAEGIITAPITAVVRKGKERFVCDARLAERQAKAISKGSRQKGSLRMAENVLDLDHIPGLSRYDRCRICVPQSCPRDCFLRLDCRYQQYLRDSRKPDIQICNHNYLLANASHRLEERPLLLRQYQALVVDEAHKLPDAARQMYTETLSAQDMDELCFLLQQTHFKSLSKRLRTVFLTLSISCVPSFAMKEYKVWAFARSAAPNLPALEEQLAEVMREADRRGYIIVNSCMEQKYGTEFWRPDLFAMLTAVQQGRVNAVMVQSLDRLSHDITTLYRILRFLQNHGAVLITTKTNLQYELYLTGLESRLLKKSLHIDGHVP